MGEEQPALKQTPQMGPELAAWRRAACLAIALIDPPPMPSGGSGDNGEECSAACNVLQPVRCGSGSVRDWSQAFPGSRR